MALSSSTLFMILLASRCALAFNFPYESVQLQDADTGNNTDIAFGNPLVISQAQCKTFPGDSTWPSLARWAIFNTTLGGALVRGIPPAAACYNGSYFDSAKCSVVETNSSSSLFVMEDPTIPSSQWQLGNPCPPPLPPISGFNAPPTNYTCNVNAYPHYVVNATTVKHVQLAVNFARNNNIRLTIKNTGHDFLGRNTGGGALQIWTHHLKAFEHLPSITIGNYTGQAARVGTAIQAWEEHPYMTQYNITLVAPISTTVGSYGGYMQGGGHGYLTSKYGLMADQVLSIEVVTADGKFVHADPTSNSDLFWAIRGGGGSTFGVVTSLVVKAYPTIPISISSFTLSTAPAPSLPNTTSNTIVVSNSTFWNSVAIYFADMPRITSSNGVGWNMIYNTPAVSSRYYNISQSFTFQAQVTLPGYTADEAKKFTQPLTDRLSTIGLNLTNPEPAFYKAFTDQGVPASGPGEGVNNNRYVSRLFPRQNFEHEGSTLFNSTIAAIRSVVEDGGYRFHSVDFAPTPEIAGYPGIDSAVNPALRTSIVHATVFDTASYGPEVPQSSWAANHARLNEFGNKLRDVTPGSGAYMNEADTQEPNFQQSFYGANYKRLLSIKKQRDPWSLFYAVTGVGSDEWVVEDTNGLPTQQGKLCKV